MKVLVCGDRHWRDWNMVYKVLDELYYAHDGLVVIEGGARGADTMAGNWTMDRKRRGWAVELEVYEANWAEHHRAAGPIRNKKMLVDGKPDLVVAFHDALEESKGTKNMVEISRKAGVEVLLVQHPGVNGA